MRVGGRLPVDLTGIVLQCWGTGRGGGGDAVVAATAAGEFGGAAPSRSLSSEIEDGITLSQLPQRQVVPRPSAFSIAHVGSAATLDQSLILGDGRLEAN